MRRLAAGPLDCPGLWREALSAMGCSGTRLVMIDTNALCDRLYADALAADLRVPGRFVAAVTKVGWDDIESHVRERAEVCRKDLLLRPASMEVPNQSLPETNGLPQRRRARRRIGHGGVMTSLDEGWLVSCRPRVACCGLTAGRWSSGSTARNRAVRFCGGGLFRWRCRPASSSRRRPIRGARHSRECASFTDRSLLTIPWRISMCITPR